MKNTFFFFLKLNCIIYFLHKQGIFIFNVKNTCLYFLFYAVKLLQWWICRKCVKKNRRINSAGWCTGFWILDKIVSKLEKKSFSKLKYLFWVLYSFSEVIQRFLFTEINIFYRAFKWYLLKPLSFFQIWKK